MRYFSYLAVGFLFSLSTLTAAAQSGTATPRQTAPAQVIKTDSVSAPAGPTVLTGTILGMRDQPLAGATVSIVTEPNKAGITNSAGGYMLRTMAESPVLRVSYAGYTAQELPITNSKPLVIRLEPIEKYEKDRKKRAKTAVKEYRKP
jgi:hypothetical protein